MNAPRSLDGDCVSALSIVIVPGLGVRRYMEPTRAALATRGHHVRVVAPPGSRRAPVELRAYAGWLVEQMSSAEPTDVLIGLSVGAQAAALAAQEATVRHLVLIAPTFDPKRRGTPRLIAWMLWEGREERLRLLVTQAGEWLAAGPWRIARMVRSARKVLIEDELAEVQATVTVVHPERDDYSTLAYGESLADAVGGRSVVIAAAVHSWPYADAERFIKLVEMLDAPEQQSPDGDRGLMDPLTPVEVGTDHPSTRTEGDRR